MRLPSVSHVDLDEKSTCFSNGGSRDVTEYEYIIVMKRSCGLNRCKFTNRRHTSISFFKGCQKGS